MGFHAFDHDLNNYINGALCNVITWHNFSYGLHKPLMWACTNNDILIYLICIVSKFRLFIYVSLQILAYYVWYKPKDKRNILQNSSLHIYAT